MACFFMEGFEYGVVPSGWYPTSTFLADISSVIHRTGTYCLRIGPSTGAGYHLGGTRTEIYCQFPSYVDTSGSLNFNLQCGPGNNLCSIKFTVGDVLRVYTGAIGGTERITGSTPISPNQWYVIEFHLKVGSVSGIYELRLDGNPVGSWIGNTVVSGWTYCNEFQTPGRGSGGFSYYWDDIIFNDTTGTVNNSWPGGLKIVRLAPTGTGDSSQWGATPPGTTHWMNVDEVPCVSADYVSTSGVGILDLYSHAALPSEAYDGGKLIVSCDAWVKKDSAGSSGSLVPTIKVGSTVYAGTGTLLPAVYSLVNSLWETNPAGTTWSISDINSLQLGFQTSG